MERGLALPRKMFGVVTLEIVNSGATF